MKLLKQSSTAQELLFLMIDSADHVSPKTGLSPTVTIRKAGGSFASPSGAVSEIANGWYKVAGNATDTNTLGPLLLHASATGADPSDVEFAVVAFDPQDAVRIGMSSLPNAAAEAAGGLYTRGTGAGQIAQQANGQIDVNLSTVKTQAVTCAAGVTVLAQVGAAAAPGTNGGLATVDASNRIAGIAGTKHTLDDLNDLSAAQIAAAVWNALTSGMTTAGSLGKKLADWVVGTIDTYTGNTKQTGDVYPLVDTEIAAIKAKTDNLPAAPAAVSDIPTAAQNAAALLDLTDGVETSITPRQAMRLMLAASAGKLSGAGTTTITIRNVGDAKARITATVDASGNRTAVTTDAT